MDELVPSIEETKAVLSEEEKKQLEEIKNRIDTSDPNTILQYGTGIQSNISKAADSILKEVHTKDTGDVGKILNDLVLKIRELDVDTLADEGGGLLSKIPFIGSLLDNVKRFMTKYQSLSVQIVKIIETLERAKAQLLRDVTILEGFYESNLEYFKQIGSYILAGEIRLRELEEDTIPQLKATSETSSDPIDTQRYRDMVQFANRLDKKLYDLKLSRTVSLQAGPQIRVLQNNNRELAEKIQSSILNTIPLWKNQLVIAMSILRQRQALAAQKEVTATTKELLEKNAEMLKESAIGITEESEKGIIDIETLKKVNAELISTIEETLRLQQEGKTKRQEAEHQLRNIEADLKAKLREIKSIQEKN